MQTVAISIKHPLDLCPLSTRCLPLVDCRCMHVHLQADAEGAWTRPEYTCYEQNITSAILCPPHGTRLDLASHSRAAADPLPRAPDQAKPLRAAPPAPHAARGGMPQQGSECGAPACDGEEAVCFKVPRTISNGSPAAPSLTSSCAACTYMVHHQHAAAISASMILVGQPALGPCQNQA